jgi:hypothetical protein
VTFVSHSLDFCYSALSFYVLLSHFVISLGIGSEEERTLNGAWEARGRGGRGAGRGARWCGRATRGIARSSARRRWRCGAEEAGARGRVAQDRAGGVGSVGRGEQGAGSIGWGEWGAGSDVHLARSVG